MSNLRDADSIIFEKLVKSTVENSSYEKVHWVSGCMLCVMWLHDVMKIVVNYELTFNLKQSFGFFPGTFSFHNHVSDKVHTISWICGIYEWNPKSITWSAYRKGIRAKRKLYMKYYGKSFFFCAKKRKTYCVSIYFISDDNCCRLIFFFSHPFIWRSQIRRAICFTCLWNFLQFPQWIYLKNEYMSLSSLSDVFQLLFFCLLGDQPPRHLLVNRRDSIENAGWLLLWKSLE